MFSYVVTHQAVHPALVGHTPMATVEVELAEGPHLYSNLLDVPPEEVEVGMAVRVGFEDVGEGVVSAVLQAASAIAHRWATPVFCSRSMSMDGACSEVS